MQESDPATVAFGDNGGGLAAPAPSRGGLGRLLRTLGVLALAALAAGFFVVRTDFGRTLIAARIGALLGEPVNIRSARIAFPYVLVLDDVTSEGTSGGGFKLEEVRLAPGVRPWLRVALDRVLVHVAQGREGEWEPRCAAGLGDLGLQHLERVAGLTRPWRDLVTLTVSDGTLKRYAADKREVSSVSGVRFVMRPLHAPGRMLYYHRLEVGSVTGGEDNGARGVTLEWVATDVLDYVDLCPRAPDVTAEAEAGGGRAL